MDQTKKRGKAGAASKPITVSKNVATTGRKSSAAGKIKTAELAALAAAAKQESESDSNSEDEEFDSAQEGMSGSDSVEDSDSEDGFEDQGSSSGDSEEDSEAASEPDDGAVIGARLTQEAEASVRSYPMLKQRDEDMDREVAEGIMEIKRRMHADDLSSDDEEDAGANTIGRVPLHWYDAYDHIGYNIQGQKVAKRKGTDRIDTLISNSGANGGEAKRTVYDMYNDREVVLSERDLEIIRRIQAGAFAHAEHNDTPDYVDYYTFEKEVMPMSSAPDAKRSFIPSKWETMRVMKIVKAIKEGRYVDSKQAREDKKKDDDILTGLFLAWNDQEDETLAESKKFAYHLPAPKIPLPGHAESYNPPPEYLLSEKERKDFEDMDPTERPYNFIPKQHSCLRHVEGYKDLIKERFERCLDLYLCPRQLKKRLNIDPETLIPRLPRPKELKPFPNSLCLQYLGHTKAVRSISVSPDGQYLVSGSDDGTVMLWEVDCCLCRHVWDFNGVPVTTVAWNPNPSHHIVAAAVGNTIVFISTGTGDVDSTEVTDSLLEASELKADKDESSSDDSDSDDEEASKHKQKKSIKDLVWKRCARASKATADQAGPRVELVFPGVVSKLAWHHRGDYFAALCPTDGARAVTIHQVSLHLWCPLYSLLNFSFLFQLSKVNSQAPFKKSPGTIQSFAFHPTLPFFFVVTQQHVKVFHLVEQKLVKRLLSGCKWLSSIDIHPSGDHVILGSYDRRVVWFDMDLSSTPYKTLKFHEKAIRDVQFHRLATQFAYHLFVFDLIFRRRFPLMASASDDGSVHVFHATVYKYEIHAHISCTSHYTL